MPTCRRRQRNGFNIAFRRPIAPSKGEHKEEVNIFFDHHGLTLALTQTAAETRLPAHRHARIPCNFHDKQDMMSQSNTTPALWGIAEQVHASQKYEMRDVRSLLQNYLSTILLCPHQANARLVRLARRCVSASAPHQTNRHRRGADNQARCIARHSPPPPSPQRRSTTSRAATLVKGAGGPKPDFSRARHGVGNADPYETRSTAPCATVVDRLSVHVSGLASGLFALELVLGSREHS